MFVWPESKASNSLNKRWKDSVRTFIAVLVVYDTDRNISGLMSFILKTANILNRQKKQQPNFQFGKQINCALPWLHCLTNSCVWAAALHDGREWMKCRSSWNEWKIEQQQQRDGNNGGEFTAQLSRWQIDLCSVALSRQQNCHPKNMYPRGDDLMSGTPRLYPLMDITSKKKDGSEWVRLAHVCFWKFH